jgi:uncharacterized protein (TIGR02246 family)
LPATAAGGKIAPPFPGEEEMPRIAVLVGCLVVAAAAPAFAQSKAAIQKLNDEWAAAFNKGDAKALAAMYAPDAYVLPPGADMVKGRRAIETFWAGAVKQLGDIKITTVEVKPLGPRAAREIGTATFMTKEQPAKPGSLKYAVVWEKVGRRWELLQDIWNTPK